MKIVLVSSFYSTGMGYVENCLPKALSSLGHDVHVLTSNLNVYGNEPGYEKNYGAFLGPANQGTGTFVVDGYKVHRLGSRSISGYVMIKHLIKEIKNLSPDIVHSIEIASLNTYILSIGRLFIKYKIFTESHQHLSVVKPFLKEKGNVAKRIMYYLTRTLPTRICSIAVSKCYAISPDCAEVAQKYYGVPSHKIKIQTLGTDTDLFKPMIDKDLYYSRRKELGFNNNDIICIYSGRFSKDKDPLILAKAVEMLSNKGMPFKSLFIGDGPQLPELLNISSAKVVRFVRYQELSEYYAISDIAVWPKQESLSMLDAASCALAVVVSDKMGDMDRVAGNGKVYKDGDVDDLSNVLSSLANKNERLDSGANGRRKMLKYYSWESIASNLINDYILALEQKK